MKKTYCALLTLLAVLWLGLGLWLWCGPRRAYSDAERRKLEQVPSISIRTVLDGRFMTKCESFAQDQFPMRDGFRTLKAIFSSRVLRQSDNNGVYLADGSAGRLEYPLNMGSVQSASEKFQRIYDRYLRSCKKIVFSVIPDKNYYLAREMGYPCMDYDALFSEMAQFSWSEYVSLTDTLSAECFYRTDAHWRQETILPAAEKIAEALGAVIDDVYETVMLDRPFYGVYCGQAALPLQPDTICLLQSETIQNCAVTNHETGKAAMVYDMEKLESRDLYDVFLSGPVSALTVENPTARDGRELIVFRDSFGSSLVPLLIPGYAKITLLDLRYAAMETLEQFADFRDRDVLFLFSPSVLNNSAMLK